MQGWLIISLALGYISILFTIAYIGDRRRASSGFNRGGWVYPLSLAVYCTSWTYFGSVGLASRQGVDFLAVYLGPMAFYGLMFPLLLRIKRIAREQNITSIADFVAARYGKSQAIAALTSVLLLIGMLPYIALQLKAVAASLLTALSRSGISDYMRDLPFFGDLALVVTFAMAAFAIMFGTRQTDATEHQDGLMLAIAVESLVKLFCFVAIGVFVCFWLFDGVADIFARAELRLGSLSAHLVPQDVPQWGVMLLLSFLASLMLPRMFHTAIVENHSDSEIRRAAWLFPLYLVGINLFVLPLALAGLVVLPQGWFDSDMIVIALPQQSGYTGMMMLAFIGGLSAATAMVIVACVALAIMVSNGLVVPVLVQFPRLRGLVAEEAVDGDISASILQIRRILIVAIMLAAYLYYRLAANAHLAQLGLTAFAAVAQLAPAFFLGLFWRRGNARGAVGGIVIGGLVWAYTLFLPTFFDHALASSPLIAEGPFGITALRPQNLFGFEGSPLVNGTLWSLGLNLAAYIILSLTRAPSTIEQQQAERFVEYSVMGQPSGFGFRRSPVTIGQLEDAVARYLGRERTSTSFANFERSHDIVLDRKAEASLTVIGFAEHLLASAIGAASSRLVMGLLLKPKDMSSAAAMRLLDEASAAIQYDRDVLQTALEHARQGLTIHNSEGRLQFWNRSFTRILDLDGDFVSVGRSFQHIISALSERGEFGDGDRQALASYWIETLRVLDEPHHVHLEKLDIVLEVRSAWMPDGGVVTTYTDITASVREAENLERANEILEQRVRERTEQLTRLNAELQQAKAEADEANQSKTRFLAAASHDVLQPLNAARLYTTSLVESESGSANAPLVHNIDASLEAVEEILGALLDMSRLDSSKMRPEWATFRLDELMRQLALEFTPIAQQRGLTLKVVACSLSVRSDRQLLRRLLQNLISNAIKYTQSGRVLVGCRRKNREVVFEVWDTGIGIPDSKQKLIFNEFQRLETGSKIARGLGLGLSIVDRIARILDHRLTVQSKPNAGSVFRLTLPIAAAMPKSRETAVPSHQTAEPLTGLTVMAIDNEETILEGMKLLLSHWGCTVMTAPDALKAIGAIRKAAQIPDCLIADYHLDDGNGIDAITHLRWRFSTAMPAVLITADRSPAVRDEAEAKGIHLLNKPLKPAALRALLTQWTMHKLAEISKPQEK